jgi:hypothetical protein
MSLAYAEGPLAAQAPARRLGAAWRRGLAIVHGLERRQWLAGVGGGFAFGLIQALYISVGPWVDRPGVSKFGLFIVIASHWVPLMTAAAGVLLFGLALQRSERDGRARPWRYLLLSVLVTTFAALVIDPLCIELNQTLHVALALPFTPGWWGRPLFHVMPFYWSTSVPALLVMVAMGTVMHLYDRRARRDARVLADAQLQLAEVQRRVLAEQLQGAQASVDPEFLFDTLNRVRLHFTSDAPRARGLLEALIRYLRAALPARGDAGYTLGQQAELLRAYVEIESLAAGDRLHARIELPAALVARPLAPLLLLPLAANALRHGIGASGEGEVALRAWAGDGRFVIDIEDDGSGRVAAIREGAGLAAVRQRLAALYGVGARLTLMDREPRGIRARFEWNEEGGRP